MVEIYFKSLVRAICRVVALLYTVLKKKKTLSRLSEVRGVRGPRRVPLGGALSVKLILNYAFFEWG